MENYKQRMIEEYKQLAERFIKLGRLMMAESTRPIVGLMLRTTKMAQAQSR